MDDLKSLPFLTRKMLAFEHALVFSLRLTERSMAVKNLTIRGITREGLFSFKVATVGTAVPTASSFRIPDIPIMVSVIDEDGSIFQGDVYVTLELMANGDRMYGLLAGFVEGGKELSFPVPNTQDPLPNRGRITQTTQITMTIGEEMEIMVPFHAVWRVIAVAFKLNTSAIVADRIVELEFENYKFQLIRCVQDAKQTASQLRHYSAASFGRTPASWTSNEYIITIPNDMWLTGDSRIKTMTQGFQGNDQFRDCSALVEQFLQPGS